MKTRSQSSQVSEHLFRYFNHPPWGGPGQFQNADVHIFVEYFTVFPRAFLIISDLVLITTSRSRQGSYYPHFTDEPTDGNSEWLSVHLQTLCFLKQLWKLLPACDVSHTESSQI